MVNSGDEWRLITELLPMGWEEAARTCGAFKRARFIKEPSELLRLLLYHAVNDGSLRTTVTQAKAAGIALDHEPEELPWGGMAFAVTDPDGFKLSIASGG